MGSVVKSAPWDPTLLKSLRAGDCIAFIGAGFTRTIDMPLWHPLIERLIQVVEPSSGRRELVDYAKSCLKDGQLARAASAIRGADNKRLIDDELKRLFDANKLFVNRPNDDKKREMTERLEALTSLPWAGYITTNYDRSVPDFLRQVGRPCNNECMTPYDNLARALKSSDRPFFIHLHGSVAGGHLILSEDDYDYAYLASPPLQNFLRAILLRYTVVFVGTLVEDRFVEMRRQLQLLFRDRTGAPNSALMSPEYVFLAETDRQRGAYLESTGGFRVIDYENKTGAHEGLAPMLEKLRRALSQYEGMAGAPDVVNNRLLSIIAKHPYGIKQFEISHEFWAKGPLTDYPDAVSPSELYFRLFYLSQKGMISYDEHYETYKPVNHGTVHNKKVKRKTSVQNL